MSDKISSQSKINSYINEAKKLREEGKLDKSIDKYLVVLKLNPNFISALNQLAEVYEEKKEFDKAISCFQKVIDWYKNKDNSQARAKAEARLALAYLKQGKTEDGITLFQSAIDKHSLLPIWVYYHLGNALAKNAQVKEAITTYKKATKLYPSDHSLHLKLASLYTQKGNFNNAIKSYKKAIRLESNLPFSVYANLAKALRQQGRQQEAIKWLSCSKEGREGKIYLEIWNSLNQTSPELIANESNQYPTDIDPQLVEQYFKLTGQYKVINLTSLSDEDQQFLKSKNISLANLELIQKSNYDSKQQDIYLRHFDHELTLKSEKGMELIKYPLLPFTNSMLETKYIYSVCPTSGKILRSNQSFAVFSKYVGIFYRFVGHEIFYLLVGLVPGGKFQINALYFPNLNLIVNLIIKDQVAKGSSSYLIHAVNYLKTWMVSSWQIVREKISSDVSQKRIIKAVEFHFNIGHNLVNDLSGIDLLLKKNILNKVDKFFVGDYEYFGSLEDLYPEIPRNKIVRCKNSCPNKEIARISLENDYLPLSIRGNFVSEDMVNRIHRVSLQKCSPSFLSTIEEATKHFPLIWISFRTHNRSWISQIEGIANIIRNLSVDFPNLGIVFDGFSFADIHIEKDDNLVNSKKDIVNQENTVVEKILALIPEKNITVYNTIGCLLHESIIWAYTIDIFIASMGAGLTKTSLLANKPGVQHSCTAYIKAVRDWYNTGHRENGISPTTIPEHHIVDLNSSNWYSSYDCDWRIIYDEALKIIRNLKRR